jgi:hypothetical protein
LSIFGENFVRLPRVRIRVAPADFLRPHESRVVGALECSLSMASRSLRLANQQLGDGSIMSSGDAPDGTIYRFISPPVAFGTFFLAVVRFVRSERLADIDDLVEFAFRIATHVAFVAFGRLDEPAGGSLLVGIGCLPLIA